MKLQHLSVIFIIIIVPIIIVMSTYLQLHIETIRLQTQYTTYLMSSTFDAIKAFQLNTQNNRYSTLSDSKTRDVTASINTFYNSLSSGMVTLSGLNQTDLKNFTPAILCNLYEGYYIYTKYYDTEAKEYTYDLKPMINYSCRYKTADGNNDFVVNYTLDNTITIIGLVNGTFVTKTGHLININSAGDSNLKVENLQEKLITLDDQGNQTTARYQYIIYNNQKVYKDASGFFYYSSSYRKDYLNSIEDINKVKTMFDNGGSSSAINYYKEAEEFSNWINANLGEITEYDATDNNAARLGNEAKTYFSTTTGTQSIFKVGNDNDPLQISSTFNEHRKNVIRKSIETNLITAIANYNQKSQTGYEFRMPKIAEEEWDKIENNVCMVSFLQGIPIKSKIYNNYCVVSNNTNQEMVGNGSIYLLDSKGEYHKPGCKKLLQELKSGTVSIVGAYSASDFERKSISVTGELQNAIGGLNGTTEGDNAYFFPQEGSACYDCIVNIADTNSTDDIIKGTINASANNGGDTLQSIYLRALARSRYDLYTVNAYFGIK